MSPQVVVKVVPGVARALHAGTDDAGDAGQAGEVLEAVYRLGVRLLPEDPHRDGVPASPFFHVQVADPEFAQEVSARLRQCRSVEAAYVKPPAEPAEPPL